MGVIRRVMEIPGPKSRAVIARGEQYVARTLSGAVPAAVAEARGALVTDLDGNRFIDLAGGIGCMNVGHSHPKVVEAVVKASRRFTHTDYTVLPYPGFVDLAERLCRVAPGDGSTGDTGSGADPEGSNADGERPVEWRALLFNSGAEAIENAVKVARYTTGRPGVIAFEGGFHGRTWMAMSLTHNEQPYKEGFGPFSPDVWRAPFPDSYRHESEEAALTHTFDRLEALLADEAPSDSIGAVIVEPIQGEGGFVVPPASFLPRLRRFCDRHGLLLIVDEIQSGYGRTGRMWACEHAPVAPDLMTIGKSMAAGLPLSGVLLRRELAAQVPPGALGGTYIGNPVACAAALAVLDVMEEEALPNRADRIGERLSEWSERMRAEHAVVGDARGLGAMRALELVKDRESKAPASEATARLVSSALQNGVVILKAGPHKNVIRFLMPLVIEEAELDEALGVIEEGLAAL